MDIVKEFCDALPKQNYIHINICFDTHERQERKRKRIKRTPQMKYNNSGWSVHCLTHNIH